MGAGATSGTTTVGAGLAATGGAGDVWMVGAAGTGVSMLCAASGVADNASAAAIAAVAVQ